MSLVKTLMNPRLANNATKFVRSVVTRSNRRTVAGLVVCLFFLMPMILNLNNEVVLGEKAIAVQSIIKEGKYINRNIFF